MNESLNTIRDETLIIIMFLSKPTWPFEGPTNLAKHLSKTRLERSL